MEREKPSIGEHQRKHVYWPTLMDQQIEDGYMLLRVIDHHRSSSTINWPPSILRLTNCLDKFHWPCLWLTVINQRSSWLIIHILIFLVPPSTIIPMTSSPWITITRCRPCIDNHQPPFQVAWSSNLCRHRYVPSMPVNPEAGMEQQPKEIGDWGYLAGGWQEGANVLAVSIYPFKGGCYRG